MEEVVRANIFQVLLRIYKVFCLNFADDAVSSTAVKTTIISRLPPDFSPTYSPPTVSESTFDTTSFTAASSALTTTQSPRVSQTLLLPAVAANASTLWLGSKARSLSLQDCSLPPDRGPCFRRLHRWYFDAVDHSCKTFIFSGCAANVNNFETRDQCMSACYREEHVNVEHDRGKKFFKTCREKMTFFLSLAQFGSAVSQGA